MLGSIVKLQPLDHPSGLLWLKGLVQGGVPMGVQVIQHHPDLLRFRVSPNPPMDGVRTAEGG